MDTYFFKIMCFWATIFSSGTVKCETNISSLNENSNISYPLESNWLMEVYEDDISPFTYNCSKPLGKNNLSHHFVLFETHDLAIGGIWMENSSVIETHMSCKNGTVKMFVKAGHLGITSIRISQSSDEVGHTVLNTGELSVHVLRKVTLFDELAVFVLGPLILFNKCAFGAKIEVDMLKRIVTHPVELSLCLLTQFIFLPLTAVGLGTFLQLDQILALALLVSAVCPGGGGGYVFSFLVEGDITVAITASLVSTLVAMVAMPAVIGTYSYFAHIPNNIVIPYIKILLMLLAIATPITLGMILRRKKPNLAKKLITVIKPLSLFLIFAGLVVVVVTSKYVMYGPKVGYILAILVPFSGLFIATVLCKLVCLDWPLTKAVALESGLKNTVLGVAVIELSFPQPQADLASILIVMITVGQVVVAMTWYFVHLLSKSFTQSRQKKDREEDPLETEMFLQHSSSAF
uniref:Sodium/bile acid cotransporter 5-like n=1 Tax=Phallusia mammillata TaxID=59560 RepID=A0A6F9DSJ7_9ASCI|nr:sodium/bile acid cotransporter 5-like [Phallusia mammillata]